MLRLLGRFDDRKVFEMLPDSSRKFRNCSDLPEANRNAGRVRGKTENIKTSLPVVLAVRPTVNGIKQGLDRAHAGRRIILGRLGKEKGEVGLE